MPATQTIVGLKGSAPAYYLARLFYEERPSLLLVVAPLGQGMNELAQELEFYLREFGHLEGELPLYTFPALDTLPYFRLSPHRDVQATRMQCLTALQYDPRPKLIVTTAAALAMPVVPKNFLQEKRQILKKGTLLDREIMASLLLDWGYQQSPLVEDRGSFAIRGGIIDCWGPLDEAPWRIELFGDTIESMRRFDPTEQGSRDFLSEVWLVPVRELPWDDKTREKLTERFLIRANELGFKATEKREVTERLRDGIYLSGVEHLLTLLTDTPSSLTHYLPAGSHIALLNEDTCEQHLADLYDDLQSAYQRTQSFERCVAPAEIIALDALKKISAENYTVTHLSDFATSDQNPTHFQVEENHILREQIRQKGEAPLKKVAALLEAWSQENELIMVASSEAQRRRLLDLFKPYGLKPKLRTGALARGFRWPERHLAIVTDAEIFGPKVRMRPGKDLRQVNFSALRRLGEGDPLVHKEHGIGLYRGLVHMEIEGAGNDFLLLEYAGGDKLYLPAYRMNLIEPYTGGLGTPKIDKLGGTAWTKTREQAQRAIQKMAGELLNLYAARAAGQGHAFSSGDETFESFEASFTYEETEDQTRTIGEVLADMEKVMPMDRLVLGDVGYGKTEVAMRAAFKAVLDKKQVALLVPTTVLAFQHYQNFCTRFRDTAVTVGHLSRFQSPAENKETLKKLALGQCDIVIGTHRLLQPDVSFKDLGLLVIDEEHRFGVRQKEKIKRLKKSVDVLALSATPIPRSLNMALTGLRGISVIETPPTDRLSIRTFVVPYSEGIVQEAILRELRRGGQVFYVYNRVETIEKVRERLQNIFPDVKIGVAHGQMSEEDLEEVMIGFSKQEYSILLCTTIIESGIDIPTANTIIIERTDLLGLSQVYQLRGRVGRGAVRAYAYLLIPAPETLTAEAKKRLAVLQRFSELGSGFKMASHDLEIRGAGNLLGEKQSGHLEAIGYELYTELLENAIKELRGEEILEEIDPELQLKVTAYIPEHYIPDPAIRLELYRRLAALASDEARYALEEEIADRFGPPPAETLNLLQLMEVKVLAKQVRLRKLHYGGERFSYHFDVTTPITPEQILTHVSLDPKRFRLTPEMKLIVQESAESEAERLEKPRYFLQSLLESH